MVSPSSVGDIAHVIQLAIAPVFLLTGVGTILAVLSGRQAVQLLCADAGHPFAGRLRLASFLLPPGMGGSEVRLRAELEVKGVRRPVRWACAQPLDEVGALVVRLKKHEDADWRKGI